MLKVCSVGNNFLFGDNMTLFQCPECAKDVSSKSMFCPHCGLPLPKLKDNLSSTLNSVSSKLSSLHSSEPVNIDDVLEYVDFNKKPRSSYRMNGLGTTFGGYMRLPGYSTIGFIKKYFSIFWIPLIPLGTYLVKDWDGSSGSFIGSIEPQDANQFVEQWKQRTALGFGAILRGATILGIILGISAIVSLMR